MMATSLSHSSRRTLLGFNPTHHSPVALKIGWRPVRTMEGIEVSLTLDVLSFHCPVPVHETKRTLSSMASGAVLLVMADDPETKMDIPALLNRSGDTLLSVHEEAGEYHYYIRKEGSS